MSSIWAGRRNAEKARSGSTSSTSSAPRPWPAGVSTDWSWCAAIWEARIDRNERQVNPLGPLQGAGNAVGARILN